MMPRCSFPWPLCGVIIGGQISPFVVIGAGGEPSLGLVLPQAIQLRCRHPGGVLGCIGAWRSGLGEQDGSLLSVIEGDAEDCAREAGLLDLPALADHAWVDGGRNAAGEQQRTGVNTWASEIGGTHGIAVASEAGRAKRYLTAVSCGLPTLLPLELLHALWTYRHMCFEPEASFVPTDRKQETQVLCAPSTLVGAVASIHRDHQWWLKAAGRGIPESSQTRGVVWMIRRFLDEYVENVALPILKGSQDDTSMGQADKAVQRVLEGAAQLGYGRRVLQWRTNAMLAVADYGLADRYSRRIAPREKFFHSRVEVLLELIRGANDKAGGGVRREWPCLVEIGVHLGRLSFAILGSAPEIRYIGVDPYAYGNATHAASVSRQLGDLGHDDADGLRSVREAAQAKIDYYGTRAKLWVLPSVEAAARLPDGSVDAVFIDGDHSYGAVREDILAWEPKLRPGGFLSGHDFGNHPDVARAVLEHAHLKNRTVRLAMDWVWYWHVP